MSRDTDRLADALNAMEVTMRERAADVAREEVGRWRNGVVTLKNWCCTDMARFASECFGVNRPQDNAMYQTKMEWRGTTMRYCPFCGVHFTVREDK